MIKKICVQCKKTMPYGKFCLDCGALLQEVTTPDTKFKKIKSNRSTTTLKQNIRSWLGRIGVQQPDIQISSDNLSSSVSYILKEKQYKFQSDMQDSEANNLAAIETWIHGRVLGIEHGLENEEQAFAGYSQLPNYSHGRGNMTPYEVMGFKFRVSLEEARVKYKELAKLCHPDVNDSIEAKRQFQELKEAMNKIEKEYK